MISYVIMTIFSAMKAESPSSRKFLAIGLSKSLPPKTPLRVIDILESFDGLFCPKNLKFDCLVRFYMLVSSTKGGPYSMSSISG